METTMNSLKFCKQTCVMLVALALAACGGSQSQSSGPYSDDLLNRLSNSPPLSGPIPGVNPAPPPSAEPSAPIPPPSEPDVVEVDAVAPAMDAAPEASAPDAGRRRTPARPAARRDGGR